MSRTAAPLIASILLAVAACAGSASPSPVTPTAPPESPAAAVAPAAPPESPDAAAIRATALDYIEGWYDGDVARMTRALHPELAKRIVVTENGKSRLEQMGAAKLIEGTRRGFGKDTPLERREKDVTILDVFENAASVKIVASDWIDYLHVARFDGRWVIVNVLWEMKPKQAVAQPGA